MAEVVIAPLASQLWLLPLLGTCIKHPKGQTEGLTCLIPSCLPLAAWLSHGDTGEQVPLSQEEFVPHIPRLPLFSQPQRAHGPFFILKDVLVSREQDAEVSEVPLDIPKGLEASDRAPTDWYVS